MKFYPARISQRRNRDRNGRTAMPILDPAFLPRLMMLAAALRALRAMNVKAMALMGAKIKDTPKLFKSEVRASEI